MKAKLEILVPENCARCPLSHHQNRFTGYAWYCGKGSKNKTIEKPYEGRAPFCPLRIEEVEPCEFCCEQEGETDKGSGNFNIMSCAGLLMSYGFNYCSKCGRKLAGGR